MRRFEAFLALTFIACAGCSPESPAERNAQGSKAAVPPAASDRRLRDPFPNAPELRLFVEADDRKGGEQVFGKPKGLLLSPEQRAQFESLIAVHTVDEDEAFAMCFIPHHFFRYFDKSGRVVGELEVCFCCAGVQQSEQSTIALQRGEMLTANFPKLEDFVRSLGERTDIQCSETGAN